MCWLQVAKYLTDDSLRSAVFIKRKTNIAKISPEDAASGLCPCQAQWIAWGEFISLAEPAAALVQDTSPAEYLAAQCRSLVDSGSAELVNSTILPASGSPLFKQRYVRVRLATMYLAIFLPGCQPVADAATYTYTSFFGAACAR